MAEKHAVLLVDAIDRLLEFLRPFDVTPKRGTSGPRMTAKDLDMLANLSGRIQAFCLATGLQLSVPDVPPTWRYCKTDMHVRYGFIGLRIDSRVPEMTENWHFNFQELRAAAVALCENPRPERSRLQVMVAECTVVLDGKSHQVTLKQAKLFEKLLTAPGYKLTRKQLADLGDDDLADCRQDRVGKLPASLDSILAYERGIGLSLRLNQ